MYAFLKFLHVASIAVWIGALITLLSITRLTHKTADATLASALAKLSPHISLRIFMPSSILALITGIGLVQVGGIGFGTLWVVLGIIGFAFVLLFGSMAAGRQVKNLASYVSAGPVDAARLVTLQRRVILFGTINLIVLLAVIWVMVAKPV